MMVLLLEERSSRCWGLVIARMTGLLFVVFSLCGSHAPETRYVALCDHLTFCHLTCDTDGEYLLDHMDVSLVVTYSCPGQLAEVHGDYNERVEVDKTRGCVTIRNLIDSDAGDYALRFTDEHQKARFVKFVNCKVIAPVTITNITCSSSDLGENRSLSVIFTGEQPMTVIWSKDGGDLPQGHHLSNHNQTLSIPEHATGLYRVTVTNNASTRNMTYTIPARGCAEHFPRRIMVVLAVVLAVVVSFN